MECLSHRLTHLSQLLHPHRTSPPRRVQYEGSEIHSCFCEAHGQLGLLALEIDPSPIVNPVGGALPEHLIDVVHNLKPLLPVGCELLGLGDLKTVGSRPIDAGGFADVWIGERNDGTMVAIKSYRYHSSSSCLPVFSRLYKEALTCSYLNDDGRSFVPFIGIYSTREHPFALVFKFMDHLNLRGYLRDNECIGRTELLLEIARGLKHMHSLGIVHGNLKITNVLVASDGHARIAGLGTAFIPSTVPVVPDIDRSFHGTASELIDAQRWGVTQDIKATTANDVYAFAVLAWEVFAGQPPFSSENVFAGDHSMLNGHRPVRPDHPELSDRMWKMIKGCWKDNPTQRKTMVEAVTVLETEASARRSQQHVSFPLL